MDQPPSGFDHRAVQALLPHRFPFLLVDRVLEFEDGRRVVALKNVTSNEPFFAGHFPGEPVMPGVLICEALAQAGAILAYRTTAGATPERPLLLAGLDGARFRRLVVPGDQLHLEVSLIRRRSPVWKLHGAARVGAEVAAEADLTLMEINPGDYR